MDIRSLTADYEDWLTKKIPVIAPDLAEKHRQMSAGIFPFMRSTFYRWSGLWPEICPKLVDAPALLAVGDLHVENFGTWRDGEGRLVWGINDCDEAAVMPYTLDLVRLATSALLALQENKLSLAAEDACDAILEGYRDSLAISGKPIVLEEDHGWLRILALGAEREAAPFWEKMTALPEAKPSDEVRALLLGQLPPEAKLTRIASRVAGLGSLGRPRFVALAEWQGGMIAREAKAMLPSAWNWAKGKPNTAIQSGEILGKAVRAPDPCLAMLLDKAGTAGWVVRRLGPHCSRVELSQLPGERDERRLLKAMGRETANVHLGSGAVMAAVRADLAARPAHWLSRSAQKMADATLADWHEWGKELSKPGE